MNIFHSKRPIGFIVVAAVVLLLTGATTVVLAGRSSPATHLASAAGATHPAAHPAAAAAQPAAVQPAATITCQLSGPRQGLEMNTVVAARMFKTVAMEKELFSCGPATGGVTQQRDLETFIELVEDANGRLVDGPNFDVSICISNPPTGVIRCARYVPKTAAVNPTPLTGCSAQSFATPDDPVVMNTAVDAGVVKTIKVDKSWYTCQTSAGTVIQDIYVFNETLERATKTAAGVATLRPFAQRFIGVECTKNPAQGLIVSCNQFPVK